MKLLVLSLLFSSQLFAQCDLQLLNTYDSQGALTLSVAFSPTGTCLATANFGDNNISMFNVNSDCTLTSVAGSPFSSDGTNPTSVAFSPTGNCLAVANQGSSTVSLFTVDPTTCTITPADSPFSSGGTSPTSVAFSPTGQCLAVTNLASSNVALFRIDTTTCTAINPTTPIIASTGADSGPSFVSFSPNGNCLAVANSGSNTISLFTVGANCSSLTPVMDSPFPSGGLTPISVLFSSNSTCLAVTNSGNNNISLFAADPATCITSLSPVSTSTTGSVPQGGAFSPDEHCFAVANRNDNTISLFTVNSNCSLTPQGTFPSGGRSPQSVSFSSSGCVAVTNLINSTGAGNGTVTLFKLIEPIVTASITAKATANCPNVPVIIFGSVTSLGNPLAGATVTVSENGTQVGSGATDEAGTFRIKLPPFTDPNFHTFDVSATVGTTTVSTTAQSFGRPNCCCPTA